MTATRIWHCFQCGSEIKPGDWFTIDNGDFLDEECYTNPNREEKCSKTD